MTPELRAIADHFRQHGIPSQWASVKPQPPPLPVVTICHAKPKRDKHAPAVLNELLDFPFEVNPVLTWKDIAARVGVKTTAAFMLFERRHNPHYVHRTIKRLNEILTILSQEGQPKTRNMV